MATSGGATWYACRGQRIELAHIGVAKSDARGEHGDGFADLALNDHYDRFPLALVRVRARKTFIRSRLRPSTTDFEDEGHAGLAV